MALSRKLQNLAAKPVVTLANPFELLGLCVSFSNTFHSGLCRFGGQCETCEWDDVYGLQSVRFMWFLHVLLEFRWISPQVHPANLEHAIWFNIIDCWQSFCEWCAESFLVGWPPIWNLKFVGEAMGMDCGVFSLCVFCLVIGIHRVIRKTLCPAPESFLEWNTHFIPGNFT